MVELESEFGKGFNLYVVAAGDPETIGYAEVVP